MERGAFRKRRFTSPHIERVKFDFYIEDMIASLDEVKESASDVRQVSNGSMEDITIPELNPDIQVRQAVSISAMNVPVPEIVEYIPKKKPFYKV